MQVQWTFKNCTSEIKEKCRSYWEGEQERIERVLSGIPSASKKLRLTVYYDPEKILQYEARGVIVLPGRSLACQISDPELLPVLDELADKLLALARKYKEQSGHFIRKKRRQQISEDMLIAQPLLVSDEKGDRKESFFNVLRPLLTYLENQARSELKIFELEGVISPGQVDPNDVVHDVVANAYERFPNRPKKLALEFWLIRILREVLEKVEWENQFVSLDQSIPLMEIDQTNVPDWFEEVLGYREEFTLSELIPDSEETEIWEKLDDAGRNVHIYTALRKLPSFQREAYLLHMVNEYSLDDISHIQDRSMEEVRKDVDRGRDSMNDYMHEAGMVK